MHRRDGQLVSKEQATVFFEQCKSFEKMVAINPANVINLLLTTSLFTNLPPTPVNYKEFALCEVLEDILRRTTEGQSFTAEDDDTLEFQEPTGQVEPEFVDVVTDDTGGIESEEGVCLPELEEGEEADFDYKQRAVEYWKSAAGKRKSLNSVRNQFRKVKTVRQLYRWEKYVEAGGTRRDKLLYISDYVLSKFTTAIDEGAIIHDIDLRRWGLEAKENIDFPTFKAGRTWIFNFKKAHGIVSRKVTKFISRPHTEGAANLDTIIDHFISIVKPNINNHGIENVFNSDESGFNFELHSGRTLAVRGEKTVEAVVQSISSTTHSYTIQPTVSADGKLLSPLYLVLKEASGQFGPRVQENLFRPSNVHISASKSGKLTAEHFKTWFSQIYLPHVGARSVLLLDSWSGHCPDVLQQLVPREKEVTILTIPKKTTGRIQPLDVLGFRIWKNFIKTFSDQVVLNNYDVQLNHRNNIIKLQSLIHNQLSSPRFKNMFKHSWFKSGYLDERPGRYENPVEYCFAKKEDEIHRCHVCGEFAIFRCAWCKKYLCFKHFFEEYHYCETYIK